MNLTKDQNLALQEVRQAMYDRLKNFSLTEEMLKDKSIFQMLNLLHLLLGHRNYIGQFSHTAIVLEELFGQDAFWDKPAVETDEAKQPGEQKPLVH